MTNKNPKNRQKISQAKKLRTFRNRRVAFVGVILTLAIGYLLANITYITVTFGAEFERAAVRQLVINRRNLERVIDPAHGGVLDRNRQPLIDNEVVYHVALDVTVLNSLVENERNLELRAGIIQTLHEELNIPHDVLLGFVDPYSPTFIDTRWRVLASQVPAQIALPLAELPHVHLEQAALRRFPDPYLAPQVLGFVRGDAAWGLELQYQQEMAGDPGRIFRSFQQGAASTIENIPARDGHWLVTTLDSSIQRAAQRIVEDAAHNFGAEYTSLIVMNPNTGEILSMAQWPSFPLDSPDDGTRFTDPAVSNFWEHMSVDEQLAHKLRIWPNFGVSRSFEPGSVFKPFVTAAAYEEGLIDVLSSHFYCSGVRVVAGEEIRCWLRSGHGSLNLVEALMVSCNPAMIEVAQLLGRDIFYSYRNDFGFGNFTGIDLPGESPVSSPAVMYTLAQLNPVELATSAMGQGFNATPIQTINGFAALINGGYLMRPHLVSQIIDAQGNVINETAPTVVRNVLSTDTSDFIRVALQDVMLPAGTGSMIAIDGFSIGGKTGTAEQGVPRGDWVVTSFVGYMPVENPQFLALSIVYRPEDNYISSGGSAGMMVRDLFSEIINERHIQPDGTGQTTGFILDANSELMPNFSGMQLREVTPILNNMGNDFQVASRGAVVSHHIPGPNQPITPATTIFLYLDGDISDLDDLVFMPNLVGMRLDLAREHLSEAGLIPVIINDAPTGRIDWRNNPTATEDETTVVDTDVWQIERQFPAAGSHIQRGTQVRLRAVPQ
ncbi:MAG: penicillin-binding transpeptidase domain-containing protein [Defluviitaleaceae bacterium]|nr:penicillin-binding transpeptidase domain-containing protein [Defluviitaleaceae bacterium]